MIFFSLRFRHHFIPAIRRDSEEGPAALIGDNLASHLSLDVVQLCHQYNIKFICLPPNATHIAQPLDVAVFGPLKRIWRKILRKWKESPEGRKCATVPKYRFPKLLKDMMDLLQENVNKNLQSGFRKCGVHPLDVHELLSR